MLSTFLLTTLSGQSCGDTFSNSDGDYSDGTAEWTICPNSPEEIVMLDFTFIRLLYDANIIADLIVYSGSNTNSSGTYLEYPQPKGCLR